MERRDSSPTPPPVNSSNRPQLRQHKPSILPQKNVPLTRSQLHRSSLSSSPSTAATIEPVDPLKLLRPKTVYERTPPPKPREKMILKKLPMKKMKRRRSPERDSVSVFVC